MADRRNKTVRDMVISMVVLGVAALIFGWLYGGASFSPGAPTADGTAPTADVIGGFQRAERMVPFTPAVPHGVPADWHANSFSVTDPATLAADELPTAQGGWLTADGSFVTLIQAKGSLSQVLTAQLENAAPATATVEAGGATWLVGPGRRNEVAWYREVGDGVVYLITGSADAAAFTAVAQSIGG